MNALEVISNFNKMTESSLLNAGLEDKVYFFADHFDPIEKTLYFSSESNICFANEKVRAIAAEVTGDEKMLRCPLVSHIRSGNAYGLLVSVTGLVSTLDDKYILLKRDEEAPVDPLLWHFPAGRLDDMDIRKNACRELREEVVVNLIDNNEDLNLDGYLVHNSNDVDLKVFVGKVGIGSFKCRPCLDLQNSTLEIVFTFELPRNSEEYRLRDNEFSRTVVFKTLEEIKNVELTSSMSTILRVIS